MSERRKFRWFRVKYSPRYVDTSVGHVCLFGEKKTWEATALAGADGPVSFAELYASVCHVAYLMRHLGVPPRSRAYLDCADEHAGIVGLLGALRGGLSVATPGRLLDPAERDVEIAALGCTVVLSERPWSVAEEDGRIVVPLDETPGLALPKELDWALPRPLPTEAAILIPSRHCGTWRTLAHGDLVATLRDPDAPPEPGLPFADTLARLARGLPAPATRRRNGAPAHAAA